MTADPDTLELRAIRAQAAVWVTDLHGPSRSPEVEAGLRRWLAEDPRHAQAFELATDAWQRSGDLTVHRSEQGIASISSRSSSRTRVTRRRNPLALLGAAALALALAGTFFWLKDPILSTGYAEQRTVDLPDGSQVTLNANSRLMVEYTSQVRQLTLTRGEVIFEVAKHQPRPFVVIAGTRKIVAVGTSFEVRREAALNADFTVTLIEGQVAVEPLSMPNLAPTRTENRITLVSAGQRLHYGTKRADTLDAPPIENVTAWQRGNLIFEDTSIRDAAQEFNRYAKRRLSVDSSVPADLRVGGVFRISDPESFARAMASAHQLHLVETADEIKITAH
jgi:transmembrane sensor